jgi:hypothetical protein
MNCKKGAVEMQNRPREVRAGGSLTADMGQDFMFVKGNEPLNAPQFDRRQRSGWINPARSW